jgi:hypothetical protein
MKKQELVQLIEAKVRKALKEYENILSPNMNTKIAGKTYVEVEKMWSETNNKIIKFRKQHPKYDELVKEYENLNKESDRLNNWMGKF